MLVLIWLFLISNFDLQLYFHHKNIRHLYLYLKYGGTTRTISALEEAIAENKYVMDLITGLEEPPKELPESYGIGSYEEAVLYYWESILTWMAHKKAILWLIRYWERRREIN